MRSIFREPVCMNCLRIRGPLHWLFRKLGMCDDYTY